MSQAQAVSGEPAVRASDGERDQAAEILRMAYADGRSGAGKACGAGEARLGHGLIWLRDGNLHEL
jgi:hypothetical protein